MSWFRKIQQRRRQMEDGGIELVPNGKPEKPKLLPGIIIGWDADAQEARVQFDPKDFKTYGFVLAVIDMAKKEVEVMQRNAHIAAMQQAAMEQARAQALANDLQGKLR